MSAGAKQFLDGWVERMTGAGEKPEGSDGVRRFAERCVRDAAQAGIAEADLTAAAGGDLPGYLIDALGIAGSDE
jgi:hypothetical protein